jgi:hypothetical protein
LLRRVRDFAEVNAVPMVTSEVALADPGIGGSAGHTTCLAFGEQREE